MPGHALHVCFLKLLQVSSRHSYRSAAAVHNNQHFLAQLISIAVMIMHELQLKSWSCMTSYSPGLGFINTQNQPAKLSPKECSWMNTKQAANVLATKLGIPNVGPDQVQQIHEKHKSSKVHPQIGHLGCPSTIRGI